MNKKHDNMNKNSRKNDTITRGERMLTLKLTLR